MKAEFTGAKSEEIRIFLRCLIDGMDFPESEKLPFCPNDQLIQIYRSIDGGKTPFADEMECERFLLGLSDEFGIKTKRLAEALRDEHTALGDIFKVIQSQSADRAPKNEN